SAAAALPRRRAAGRSGAGRGRDRDGQPDPRRADPPLWQGQPRLRRRDVVLARRRGSPMPEPLAPVSPVAASDAVAAEPLAVSRRRLLQLATAAFAAWQAAPWAEHVLAAVGPPGGTRSDAVTTTLEAFSDTLIPGAKRYDGDVAVAGVVRGPGAVQAGAVDLMWFPQAAIGPGLPALAGMLNARAAYYAAQHRLVLDPTLPPFVSLSFAHRTRLCLELLDPAGPDYLVWWALAAMPFLAF